MSTPTTTKSARFDLTEVISRLPETAKTMLADEYLTDREAGSCRVFRVYRGVPPHFHHGCDEYLYVLSGRGTFWMEDAATEAEFGPGQLLFFERGTVHALPRLIEEPVVFLSVDTPRRAPTDVVFVDPADGSAGTFMARNTGNGAGSY